MLHQHVLQKWKFTTKLVYKHQIIPWFQAVDTFKSIGKASGGLVECNTESKGTADINH